MSLDVGGAELTVNVLAGLQPHVQLVVYIMVGNREDLYSTVKKLCCVKNPIPSQVCHLGILHFFIYVSSQLKISAYCDDSENILISI